MTWSTIELSKGQRDNIKLALSVADENQEWACLTNELAIYQGGLTNVPPKSGVDSPLKFKEGEGASVSRVSGVGDFNPNCPMDRGNL